MKHKEIDCKRVDIAQSSVNRIVKKDLRLVCFKKLKAHELTDAKKQAKARPCTSAIRSISTRHGKPDVV